MHPPADGAAILRPVIGSPSVPPPAELITLDDAAAELARIAATPPVYASGPAGLLIFLAPVLLYLEGSFGGRGLSIWSDVLNFFFLIFGAPCLIFPWLAVFFLHRHRVRNLRLAIATRRAWRISGPLQQAGRRAVVVENLQLNTIHRVRIPEWVGASTCTVVFADPRLANPGVRFTEPGVVISIAGPGGGLIYPQTGAVPNLLKLPTLIASALLAFAFTASCNSQAQSYADASTRLSEIQRATPCTGASRAGDDCSRWVAGTVEWTGSSSVQVGGGSTCSTVLRWQGGQQDGDIHTDLGDCSEQLAGSPMAASIQLVKNYAIQVVVGRTLYRTDRWPPNRTVDVLAVVFRIAAFVWLLWPFVHLTAAVLFRLAARSARRAGTPSPPAPALGSPA